MDSLVESYHAWDQRLERCVGYVAGRESLPASQCDRLRSKLPEVKEVFEKES